MKSFYTFDQVRFCSPVELKKLTSIINRKKFRSFFAGKITRNHTQGKTRINYLSRCSGRPFYKKSSEFFPSVHNHLSEAESVLTYVEIACDTYFLSEQEAINAYLDIADRVFLAYGNGEYQKYDKKSNGRGFFDGRALNLGQRGDFQFCIYTRYCKVTGKPILRKEWRITGNEQILKKLEIQHEVDIPLPSKCYKILEEKYYRTGTINQNRVNQLMKLRNISMSFQNILDFQNFYYHEKRSAVNECARYKKALKRAFTYYITIEK